MFGKSFLSKGFALLEAMALLFFLVSCEKKENGENSQQGSEPGSAFRMDFSIEDGLMDVNGMVSEPKVKFTLVSSDKARNYTFDFSVDGGPAKSIKSIKHGDIVDISTMFSSFNEYGSYSLEGKVFDSANSSGSFNVSKTVWVKYVPAENESFILNSSSGREVPSDTAIKLFKSEDCVLEFSYEPQDTYMFVSVSTDNEEVLSVGELSHEKGRFSIPFSSLNSGSASLLLEINNGPDVETKAFHFDVMDITLEESVSVDFSLESDLVFGALPLRYVVDGASGDASRRFRVDYLVDGVVVATDESVALNGVVRKSVSGTGLGIGEHVASVKATALDGRGLPLEREQAFTVVDPMLSITGGAYNGVPVGSGSSLTLDVGNTYVVSLAGVPEAFADRFVFGTSGDGFSVSGSAPWSVSPTSYGRGSFTLRYTCGDDSVDVLSVGVLRRDVCELLLEWKHAKGLEGGQMKVSSCNLTVSVTGKYASSLSVPLSGSLSYRGVCEYPVASKVIKDNSFYNTKETKTTSGGTRDWGAFAKGAGSVALDLLQQATAIETSYISAGYWTMDTIREGFVVYDSELSPYHAYLAEGQFYYELVVSSVSVRLAVQPQEGLLYRLKVSGIDRSKVSVSSPLEIRK